MHICLRAKNISRPDRKRFDNPQILPFQRDRRGRNNRHTADKAKSPRAQYRHGSKKRRKLRKFVHQLADVLALYQYIYCCRRREKQSQRLVQNIVIVGDKVQEFPPDQRTEARGCAGLLFTVFIAYATASCRQDRSVGACKEPVRCRNQHPTQQEKAKSGDKIRVRYCTPHPLERTKIGGKRRNDPRNIRFYTLDHRAESKADIKIDSHKQYCTDQGNHILMLHARGNQGDQPSDQAGNGKRHQWQKEQEKGKQQDPGQRCLSQP